MAVGRGYQLDQLFPDVPCVCAAHARNRLRANSEHDLHHEPRLSSRPHGVFGEQGGAARPDAIAGAGTGARRHNREWHQPGTVRNRNEFTHHAEPGGERAISGEHSRRAMGESGGDRLAGGVPLLGRSRLHYRDRHSDRWRMDRTVTHKMTRRDAGWMILQAAAVAGGSEFFSGWLGAAQAKAHAHGSGSNAPPDPHNWTAYKPQFFAPEDFHNLDVFTAILIPTDDTPGAREACVAPFIDFVVHSAAEYAPDMQERWRKAMAWLRSQEFGSLSPEQQIALVERISRGPGSATYKLIK